MADKGTAQTIGTVAERTVQDVATEKHHIAGVSLNFDLTTGIFGSDLSERVLVGVGVAGVADVTDVLKNALSFFGSAVTVRVNRLML